MDCSRTTFCQAWVGLPDPQQPQWFGGTSSGLRLPICKTGRLDSLLSKRPSSAGVEWGGLARVPERRPLQLRFNKPSVQLELIKTRLELSRVSDLHGLKPPRIHPSLFPVNNWAPVGFPGRAGRLTSSLHSELDQARPGGKDPQPGLHVRSYPPWWLGLARNPPRVARLVGAARGSPRAARRGVWLHRFLHARRPQAVTELSRTVTGGGGRPLLRSSPQPLRGPERSHPLLCCFSCF